MPRTRADVNKKVSFSAREFSVHVLARIDDATCVLLESVVGQSGSITKVHSVEDLIRVANNRTFDALVLDASDSLLQDHSPGRVGPSFVALTRAVGLPVIVVSTVARECLTAVLAAARATCVGLILRQRDGSLDGAREALEEAILGRIVVSILREMERVLSRPLTPSTQRIVTEVLRNPAAFQQLDAILTLEGRSSVVMNAALRDAGMVRLHELRRVARVAHMFDLVTRFGLGLKEVAARVGVGSTDSLIRETKKLTGITPTLLVSTVDEQGFVDLALAKLVRIHQAGVAIQVETTLQPEAKHDNGSAISGIRAAPTVDDGVQLCEARAQRRVARSGRQ